MSLKITPALLAQQFGSGLGFNLSWFVWGQMRSLGLLLPPGEGAHPEAHERQEREQEWDWQLLFVGIPEVKPSSSSGLCPSGDDFTRAEIPEENWWEMQDSPGSDQSQGCRDSTGIPTVPVSGSSQI